LIAEAWSVDSNTAKETYGAAALKLDRRFIGIDLDRQSFATAKARLGLLVSQQVGGEGQGPSDFPRTSDFPRIPP
jgi:hypothetical protein